MTNQDMNSPLYIAQSEFSCQGQSEALGHPKIYLNFGKKKELDCPYCGQRYIHEKTANPEERMFFKSS